MTPDETVEWGAGLLVGAAPVQDAYRTAAPEVHSRLTEDEYRDWVQSGLRLLEASFRTWPVAAEYFRTSAALLERFPYYRLTAWAALGGELAGVSPDLAVAYFRAGPGALPRLAEGELEQWRHTCMRLYDGGWQSGALVSKLFEASPELLHTASVSDLAALTDLLAALARHSYPLATQCIGLAQDALGQHAPPHRHGVLRIATVLAKESPRYAREWLMESGVLMARVAAAQRADLLALSEAIAEGVRNAAWFIEDLRVGTQVLLTLNTHEQARLLELAARVQPASGGSALALLGNAGTLLERLTVDELERWVEEGMDALAGPEAAGHAYFTIESSRAHQALRRLARGVELAPVAEVLRLYCKALTGIDAQVMPTEELTRRGIGWTAERQPTTEGTTVYLPALMQSFPTQGENFACLKVCATHQAAHLEFGSFNFDFERSGVLFPRLRGQQEPAKAGARSLTPIERFFDLFPERRMGMDIFTVLEDARVDGRLHREYPGIRATLHRMQEHAAWSRPPLGGLPLRTAFLEALLERTLDPERPLELPAECHEAFAAALGYVIRLQERDCPVEDTAEATLRVYALLQSVPNLRSAAAARMDWAGIDVAGEGGPEPDFENSWSLRSSGGQSVGSKYGPHGEEEEDGDYQPLQEVAYRGDFKPQLVQTLMRLKDLKGDQTDSDFAGMSPQELKDVLDKLGETEVSELLVEDTDVTSGLFATNLLREAGQEASQGSGNAPHTEKGELTGEELRPGAPKEFSYDEWDFRANIYRHNWCLVKEQLLDKGEPAFFDETLRRHYKLANAIQRQFQLLRPELFRKIKHLPDGEEYDLDEVIQSAVDRRVGVASSEKLYWRRNKEQRSVAMAFLLDVSASTDEDIVKQREPEEPWDPDEDPRSYMVYLRERMKHKEDTKKQRRRIIDVEKESAALLIQALETLGDTYGVYGFSGYGRDNVEVFVVKDLEEQFGESVKARLDKVEPVRGTRMGAAIRHALAKLDAWDARLKVLLLLSDGRPQDHNYGRDRTEKEYALQDTRKALLEAKQKHIIPFALTVDREGHDYLKTICEGIGYEVVEDIESLPSRLPALYRQLTV